MKGGVLAARASTQRQEARKGEKSDGEERGEREKRKNIFNLRRQQISAKMSRLFFDKRFASFSALHIFALAPSSPSNRFSGLFLRYYHTELLRFAFNAPGM
jgi:hypothetical protein